MSTDDASVFRDLLFASTDNIYVIDRNLRYTHVSRSGAAAIGFTSDQMIGKSWRELGLPKETMEPVEALWKRIFTTGETTREEIQYGGRTYEYSMFPVAERVAVVSRDVTDRVEAENEVRRASERYRSFVANSTEAIWRFELSEPINTGLPEDEQIALFFERGFLAECNDATARMYGFERAEQIIGVPLRKMLDPAQEDNRRFLQEFIRSGYALHDADSIETDRFGHRKFFVNSFHGIVDEKGLLLRAWGTQRDVTAQKTVEEKLAADRARAEFLTAANDLFAATLDYEQTLRNLASLASPRLADWCAVDMVEPDGRLRRLAVVHPDPEMLRVAYELQERFPPDPDAKYGLANVVRTGRTEWIAEIPESLIASTVRSDEHRDLIAKLRIRSYIAAPIHVGDRVAGVLTLVNTIDSRPFDEADVHLAEQLALRAGHAIENARLYGQAVEANRAKDDFLATLSHELRTPLTAILGWAHLLRTANYDAETVRTAIATIERSAKTQAAIIDDLLDVSRIVTGKFALEVSDVDAVQIAANVVASAQPAADAKQIELTMNAPAPVVLRGDGNRIQQIIWNLVSNAVKFTGSGGRVTVSVSAEGQNVVIRVSDDGAGIAPDLLPRVFDRFWQADSSTHRTQGGLGLGLSIVKHLTELHGGTVQAASEGKGRGATFTVRLPIGPVAEGGERGRPATNVLLVDDDAAARDVIGRTLETFGARVTRAASADEAIGHLAADGFDLVLTDLAMPGHDGYWLLHEIRKRKPRIRVAAITALGLSDEQISAAGFDGCVRKPVEAARLSELLGLSNPL